MDEKLKEQLIYHILKSTSIIPVPLEDGHCMFLFRWLTGPEEFYEKKTNFSGWKKLFFSKTKTVFYQGKIITDEPEVRVIKDVSGRQWITSSSKHMVEKICSKHFREIMESPEFLTSNLLDDRIKISNHKYLTPIKNLLRELGLIKKKGPSPKYNKDKLDRAEKTHRNLLDIGKRITMERRKMERQKGRNINNTEMKEIKKKLGLEDFSLVKEVVLYGTTHMALRRTSEMEDIPYCQLKKLLHDKNYREKIMK